MTGLDAVRAGFRRVGEAPPLVLGEMAWRWSFAAAGFLLVAIAVREWLGSVLIFGPAQPVGPGARLAIVTAILIGGLGLLSSFATGLGRSATVSLLFRTAQTRPRFNTQLGLALFRAALALAALLAYPSAWKLASWPTEHHALPPPPGGTFFSIFLPLALLVSVIWVSLQFLLTVACLYASLVEPMPPISAAVALLDRRTPELATIAAVFLLLRTLASSVVLTIGLAALQTTHRSPAAAFALVVTGAIFYAVLNDFLLISRMAAYAAVVEDDLLGSALSAAPSVTLPNLALPDATPAES